MKKIPKHSQFIFCVLLNVYLKKKSLTLHKYVIVYKPVTNFKLFEIAS